jgi:Zn-dependent metalloprotease
MKKHLLLFLVCIVWGGGKLLAQKYQPKYLREDNKEFKNLATRITESGWIEFKKEARINPNTFFKDYSGSIGLTKDYDFKAFKEETDKKQNKHQRFLLHYKNIPVEGAEFSLHSSIESYQMKLHIDITDNTKFV